MLSRRVREHEGGTRSDTALFAKAALCKVPGVCVDTMKMNSLDLESLLRSE